ncbi:MAG: DUF3887 domain-containing protein [Bacillota bacterium]
MKYGVTAEQERCDLMFKRYLVFILFALLAFPIVSCSGGSEVDFPPLEGEITDLADQFIAHLVEGDYEAAVSFFEAKMKRAMPAKKLDQTWQVLLNQVGPYVGAVEKRTDVAEGYDVVFITTEFEKEMLIIRVVFDSDKRIAGLWFNPAL